MSTLRKTLSVGKVKYSGPKNSTAIIKQIKKDIGTRVTLEFIKEVIYTFFSCHGLGRMMHNHDSFRIYGVGVFYMHPNNRAIRNAVRKKQKDNRKKSHQVSLNFYRRRERVKERLRKINDYRASNNLKPISLKEFIGYKYPHYDNSRWKFKDSDL